MREAVLGMVTVFVPGEPAPQGSVKGFVVAGHAKLTHDNAKTMPWRSAIQAEVLRETGRLRIEFPEAEPVAIDIEFIMPRRASEPKRRTRPHTRKPDGDKLARSVGDALTGVIYRDDAQVVRMSWVKRTAEIGEMPGARITWSLAEEFAVPLQEARASLAPSPAAGRTRQATDEGPGKRPAMTAHRPKKAHRPSTGESRRKQQPGQPGSTAPPPAQHGRRMN